MQPGAEAADARSAFVSGAAMFTFDATQRIRSWNRAAEQLTGHDERAVVGRNCWEVLCGHDDAGVAICRATCAYARLLRQRWPVTSPTMSIRTIDGAVRVSVPMVRLGTADLVAAVMVPVPLPAAAPGTAPAAASPGRLTDRQRTVLAMLCAGKGARAIAMELNLSEPTVRNHIRGILSSLGCRSQLAAVAEARRLGLFDASGAGGAA